MKNFYEATVIKPTLTVTVRLIITPVGKVPCLIKLNSKTLYEDILDSVQALEMDVLLTDPIDLSIQIYRHHPDAVALDLYIDGYEILPKYQHLASPPCCYIDFNNVWVLKIPNFYPWYHEITGQGWII